MLGIAWVLLKQSLFQAGCPSCCPTSNVKALKGFVEKYAENMFAVI